MINGLGLAWKSRGGGGGAVSARWALGTEVYRSKISLDTPALFAWTLAVILLSAAGVGAGRTAAPTGKGAEEMIGLRNVTFRHGDRQVLEHLDLTVPDRGVTALTGPSGIGKTTVLRLLAGLEQPDSGRVEGVRPGGAVMLFQENRLLPWRTVNQALTDVLPRARWSEAADWLALADLTGEEGAIPAPCPAGCSGGWRWCGRWPGSKGRSCFCWTSRSPGWTRSGGSG